MSRTVEEWRITGDPNAAGIAPADRGNYPWYEFKWPRPGTEALRQGEDPDDGETAARAFWTRTVLGRRDGAVTPPWAEATLTHRTVTYTDWDEVETCPSEPEPSRQDPSAPSGADGSAPTGS